MPRDSHYSIIINKIPSINLVIKYNIYLYNMA